MDSENIIQKLKESGLLGRGGAEFPTWQKWQQVLQEEAEKKYVICNASEGEPGVFKDGFILENYPKDVVSGIKAALEVIPKSSAILYLRKDYYEKFKSSLTKLIGNLPVKLFKKTGGYLAGEETVVLNAIEGKRLEPRLKPPFPTKSGVFGCPTLINNVETFYYAAKIAEGNYKKKRFYSVSGAVGNPGVFELPLNHTIAQVLEETKNWPQFDFFVQSGGGASGEILLPGELDRNVYGLGALIVYDRKETDPVFLMEEWIKFFAEENCDKCVPCREGTIRILNIIEKLKWPISDEDKEILDDLFFALHETSFCAFGKGVPVPFEGLLKKICGA